MVEAAAAVAAQSTADGLVPPGVRKFVKWWTLWEMPDMTRQRPLLLLIDSKNPRN